MMYIMYRLL